MMETPSRPLYRPLLTVICLLLAIVAVDLTFRREKSSTGGHHRELTGLVPASRLDPRTVQQKAATGVAYADMFLYPKVLQTNNECRPHVITYLVQKTHSSYKRDSYGIFLKSLDLLNENYLKKHHNDVHVYLFHTNDYTEEDFLMLRERYPHLSFRLINLSDTVHWQVPEWLQNEDHSKWAIMKTHGLGYRHMIRWYAIKIWEYFDSQPGCNRPEYILRMDEDSNIYSPIEYNLFDFMKSNDYNYGFRQCAFVMYEVKDIWAQYLKDRKAREPTFTPIRDFHVGLCGFYNNFFMAKLDFFTSPNVQDFLQFVDKAGDIYRKRTGDLGLHTSAIYAFSPPEKIHRFLDFTYEHWTLAKGCPHWGGIMAGTNDAQGSQRVEETAKHFVEKKGCKNVDMKKQLTDLTWKDLSPTYNHIPEQRRESLHLKNFRANRMDTPQGIMSG